MLTVVQVNKSMDEALVKLHERLEDNCTCGWAPAAFCEVTAHRTAVRVMSRFIDVRTLSAGDEIRHQQERFTVGRVERSPDNYHWRIYGVADDRMFVVPPGARFTRWTGPC